MSHLGNFTSQDFVVCICSFFADSSSPQISAILFAHFARENGQSLGSVPAGAKIKRFGSVRFGRFGSVSCSVLTTTNDDSTNSNRYTTGNDDNRNDTDRSDSQ